MPDTNELKNIQDELHQLEERVDPDSWHLDKKVPLAVIFAILVQTSAVIFFGAQLASRVSHIEETVSRHEQFLRESIIDDNSRSNRITALEESSKHINQQLDKMDSKLDKLIENLR